MQERGKTENCLKLEELRSKIYKNDVLRYCIFASNNAMEIKNLESLNLSPIWLN